MNEIASYVEKAFENVPASERKAELTQEIIQSLEDAAAMWMEKGKARDDAVNKAIVEFGDLGEILLELRGEAPDRQQAQPEKAKNAMRFSLFGSLIITALMVFINLYYTPGTIWFIYPVFGVLWWPLSLFFFGRWRRK